MPRLAPILRMICIALCAVVAASLSACELCLPETLPPVTDTTSSQGA